MRFEIRTRDDGRYEVVDKTTGQIRSCGSAGFASYMQACLIKEQERKDAPRR